MDDLGLEPCPRPGCKGVLGEGQRRLGHRYCSSACMMFHNLVVKQEELITQMYMSRGEHSKSFKRLCYELSLLDKMSKHFNDFTASKAKSYRVHLRQQRADRRRGSRGEAA